MEGGGGTAGKNISIFSAQFEKGGGRERERFQSYYVLGAHLQQQWVWTGKLNSG